LVGFLAETIVMRTIIIQIKQEIDNSNHGILITAKRRQQQGKYVERDTTYIKHKAHILQQQREMHTVSRAQAQARVTLL